MEEDSSGEQESQSLDRTDDGNLSGVLLRSVSSAKKLQPLKQEIGSWIEIRLFISSTFVDTHAERDALVKRIIPNLNRKLHSRYIRIVPVDLRWGVLAEESKDCKSIQKTCLNQIDKCRLSSSQTPWFLGLRTERYGWVQDDLMPSHGFEMPALYSWIDHLKNDQHKHDVSITSLECIHAVQPPKDLLPTPNVFFYHRHLRNPENIEDDMRWLFEFEYVSPDVQLEPPLSHQYVVTTNADGYENDKKRLDEILQQLPHVKWFTYECLYEKGRARYTFKRTNAKSFGVGYTDGLEEFELQVEKDLLEAIEKNFEEIQTDGLTKFQLEKIQHENSMKEKAAGFVGRSQLINTGTMHCTQPIKDKQNTMILHGEPGCGKTGLLSAISCKILSELRNNGDFVFIHIVDSCPGSNVLETMLRRLQLSLRCYREQLGEANQLGKSPQSVNDLKKEHHLLLEETAKKYPDRKFVVVVDAVNQFHKALQAWSMWWLPKPSTPTNVRFLITTLNRENNTYDNACKVSPDSVQVLVDEMSMADLKEMVTEYLSRFNKKLTVTDDKILGNQMQILLSKSKSPLYIVTTCEALRKFGIFESISEYLSKLPSTVVELFSFLLEEWARDYGKDLVADVVGLLYVSKHGLLETEINDLLAYKEKKEATVYQSSFSLLYDALSGFLSAGGGGFLHFFHDQLKYTVKEKYITSTDIERSLHAWLQDFFFERIFPQLKSVPTEAKPANYEHILQQVVYHQLASVPSNESLSILQTTLRNIYFVRERVMKRQEHDLNDEYVNAIEGSIDPDEIVALKKWSSFVQMYAPAILEFPKFSYNMAINQSPSSCVRKDTESNHVMPAASRDCFPLHWVNMSTKENPMIVKYVWGKQEFTFFHPRVDCVASPPDKDICAFTDILIDKAFIFDQSSGEVLHELNVKASSLSLSPEYDAVWIGDKDGYVSVWDVKTGALIVTINKCFDSTISWIEHIGDIVICGTRNRNGSTIATFDADTHQHLRSWPIKLTSYCYCYHPTKKLILTGHKDWIYAWDLEGNLKIRFPQQKECRSLCAHVTKDFFLSESNTSIIRQWSISKQQPTLEIDIKDEGSGNLNCHYVQYSKSGDRIITLAPRASIIRIYSLDGILQNELKGHQAEIGKIVLIPDSDMILTADKMRMAVLWDLAASTDLEATSERDEDVRWCSFLPGGNEYITLSNEALRIWSTETMDQKRSMEIDTDMGIYRGYHRQAIHPNEELICITSFINMYWFKLSDLQLYHKFRDQAKECTDACVINCFKISPNGFRFVASYNSFFRVYDITDLKETKLLTTYREHFHSGACDIHPDNIRVATCSEGVTFIWNMESGETLMRFEKDFGHCFIKFFTKSPNRIIYDDGHANLFIRDLLNDDQCSTACRGHKTDSQRNIVAELCMEESRLVSGAEDGTIRVFDTTTGECLYAFFHHEADVYTCLSVHPSNQIILARNTNGKLYFLRTDSSKDRDF